MAGQTNYHLIMPKFTTGKELEDAVYSIIWEAERNLLIVSPYISLGNYFRELFDKHLTNPRLHITLIFGKNEDRINKSLNKADLDYFLQFPNISIVYVPALHAKYYANDTMGVVTSINLYDYSFRNNIEFGVLYERKGISLIGKNTDTEVWDASMGMANEHEVVFIRRPVFQKGFLSKNYTKSMVLLDRTPELYSGKALTKGAKRLEDFEEELDLDDLHRTMPTREDVEKKAGLTYSAPKPAAPKPPEPGYCIRTGARIPFNPKQPFSRQAYQSWSKFKNDEYAEKYCHYSGEPSNGETSFKRPILNKYWRKATEFSKA